MGAMDGYQHDGLRFEVTDLGPADGPVVIALHGFPEDRHCWDQLAAHLTADGRRVLAPDQRGYSPEARPAGRRAYRLDHLVGDVMRLIDEVGADQVDLLGHDWGAVVAWAVAAAHPERTRTVTALSVPHPRAFVTAVTRSRQLLHSWYMLAFQVPWLPERALGLRSGQVLAEALRRDGLDEASAQRYAARAATPQAMAGPIAWYRALALSAAVIPGPVSVPALFVWGSADRYVTAAAAGRCGEQVTGPYRFVALPGRSHWLPSTAADEVAGPLLDHLRDPASSDQRSA